MKILLILIFLSFNLLIPLFADNFQEAVKAYDNRDYEKALSIFSPLAKENNAEAQNYLGIIFLRGLGVSYDDEKAAYWIKKSAEQGYAHAPRIIWEPCMIMVEVLKEIIKRLFYGFKKQHNSKK